MTRQRASAYWIETQFWERTAWPLPAVKPRTKSSFAKLEGLLMKIGSRITSVVLLISAAMTMSALAQLLGPVNFVVLRVTFSDFGTGTRFNASATQATLDNIATLCGNEPSYVTITLQ